MKNLAGADSHLNEILTPFINESENFLLNTEKHYRIKYVIDIVASLVNYIQNYSYGGTNLGLQLIN